MEIWNTTNGVKQVEWNGDIQLTDTLTVSLFLRYQMVPTHSIITTSTSARITPPATPATMAIREVPSSSAVGPVREAGKKI